MGIHPGQSGSTAREAGKDLIDNPYERESPEWEAWKRGWMDQHFKAENKYAERARELTTKKELMEEEKEQRKPGDEDDDE
jgi:hypothetical protein